MIYVAHENGSIELLEPLQKAGYPAMKLVMPFADFAWEGRGEGGKPVMVGVERKEIRDLISSLRTGRLAGHQLEGLQHAYDYRWLLVEGEYRVNRKGIICVKTRDGWMPAHGSMTLSELNKELFTLCHRGGLYLWHTASIAQTVQWLGSYYRWWTDSDLDDHKSHLVIYHVPALVPVSQFRFTVSTLPEIGYKTSLWVEERFGNLRQAFAARQSAWEEVKGIGKVTAKKIMEAIDGK